MVIGRLLLNQAVYWLGATPECAEYSVQYGTYVLYAAPFMIGSVVLNMCLKSEGSATYAMIGIGFGGILNCFLDPLFIYYFDLGVAGASMATAISKIVSFCILCMPYIRKKTMVILSIRKFRLVMNDVKEVLAIGSSSFFRTLLFNSEADAEVMELGMLCVRLQAICLVFHGLSSQVNMFFAGIGKAKLALVSNFARQGYCFYPALLIASLTLGIYGVAATQALADLISAFVMIPLWFHGLKLIKTAEAEGHA